MNPTLKKYALIVLGSVSGTLLAQNPATPPAAPAGAADEEIVQLSPFTVSGEPVGRYATTEATSGARVAVPLMDSTQHVSVVTRDLMDDIGIGRLLDAAKYVAGISEATIPNAQDRTNIRGFQVDGVTLDGFSYFTFGQLDPVVVDRIEVVKGPNAILAPQGVPGGTINVVSKRPLFSNRGYLSAEVGRWSADRAEFDVNRVITPNKFALRVVGAAQDTDDYPGHGNSHRSLIVMPMATYRFSPDTELTVQVEAYEYRLLDYLGIPLDPYVGTNDRARLIGGVPRDSVFVDDDTYRYQKALHTRVFFTTNFTERFSMRMAGNWIVSTASSSQSNLSGSTPVVIDPATGAYAVSPTATVTRTYTRSFGNGLQTRRNFDLQNDFLYHLKTDAIDSRTVFGYWLNQTLEDQSNYNYTKPPFDIDAYTAAAPTFTGLAGSPTFNRRVSQLYVSQNLSLLRDRLIVSGGVAQAYYQNHVFNKVPGPSDIHNPASNDPQATMPSYGVVLKPVPQVSLFYGFSKQSTAIDPSTTTSLPYKLQTSRQNEYGVRVQLLDNKIYATWSHFDIKQNNFSVPNPGNLTVPPPNPTLPPLFMDRNARGWEFECTAAITPSLSLIGNYTSYTNRNPFGQVFRGNAEKSGAVWGSYAFRNGTLKGLTVGVGLDYLDKRPGDAPSGTPTSASTPTNIIMPQPTFWLPARTLVNASIVYTWNTHYKAQLNIDNLFDKDYLAASINRYMVIPGTPLNARLTITYTF
jgi:iron complex outermembrane receptor protein